MTQANFRNDDAVSNFGVESSFGVAATTSRLTVEAGSFVPRLEQAEVEVLDESPELYDDKVPLLGLKDGGCDFTAPLRMLAALLSSSTFTPAAFHELMRAAFGGMSPASGASVGGTTAASPGSATAVVLVSASNFSEGQWILIPTANGLEPARIASIATNTLTLNPGLSATPSANAAVSHCVTFFPDPGSVLSGTFEHAIAGSASEQYRLRGCVVDKLALKIAQNEILKADVSLKAADWDQGTLSLSTAVASDGTGGPIAKGDGALFLLQAQGTATPTHYALEEFGVEFNLGLDHLPDLGGTKQGKSGAMRVGVRQSAVITATFAADSARISEWSGRTALQCGLHVPKGSGSSRQWAGVHMPLARIIGNPVRGKSQNGRTRYTVKIRPQIDTSLATTILKAPYSVYVS